MVGLARRRNGTYDPQACPFIHGNVLDIELEPADAVIANYTIQFLPPPRAART